MTRCYGRRSKWKHPADPTQISSEVCDFLAECFMPATKSKLTGEVEGQTFHRVIPDGCGKC
jgi:hypothetical protein